MFKPRQTTTPAEAVLVAPLVAVYGSLKRGFGNHGRLAGAEFLGECRSDPGFTMYGLGGFPCIVPEGEGTVVFEVYRVNPTVMQSLDWLEGYPSFYDRMLVNTPYGQAWTYIHHEAPTRSPVVEDGNWQGGYRRAV